MENEFVLEVNFGGALNQKCISTFLLIGFDNIQKAVSVCNSNRNLRRICDILLLGQKIPSNIISVDVSTYEDWYTRVKFSVRMPIMVYNEYTNDLRVLSEQDYISVVHGVRTESTHFRKIYQNMIWIDVAENNQELSEWIAYKKEVNPALVPDILNRLTFGLKTVPSGELLFTMNSALTFSDFINSVTEKEVRSYMIAYHNPRYSTVLEVESVLEDNGVDKVSIVVVDGLIHLLDKGSSGFTTKLFGTAHLFENQFL